jgi:uncharacterized Zn finger protein
MPVSREKRLPLRVIVSSGERAASYTVLKPAEEMVCRGDEFIVETGGGEAVVVEVTSIESQGRRVERAAVESIQTVWARDVERVVVKVSINLGAETKSIKYVTPGDKEFIIGSSERYRNIEYVVKKIKLRRGGFVFREGRRVLAKDVKRVFAYLKGVEGKKRRRGGRSGLIEGESASWSLARKRRGS